jgi:invasion protein IalB
MRYASIAFFLYWFAAPALAAPPAAAAATTTTANVAISGWKLECSPTKDALACRALDTIVQASNGGLVIGFSLVMTPDGKTNLTINVPLGTSVRTPVGVSIAGGPAQNFPFLACGQQGCFATGNVNADLLSAMRAAKTNLTVTYGVLDGNLAEHVVTASLPLTGFPEVYDKLK